MKSYINRKKVGTRAELSNIASIGGLVLLLASLLLPTLAPKSGNLYLYVLFTGGALAMAGIYYANRWVRKPRPEEQLDRALKGLGDTFHLFHYPDLPCDHVLLTPNGLVVLETVALAGAFTYKGGRWREAMSMGRALRYVVEEHVGDPIASAQRAERVLKERLSTVTPAVIPMKSIVVFIHPGAELEIENAPIPILVAEKLKKQAVVDAPRLELETYEAVHEYLKKSTGG